MNNINKLQKENSIYVSMLTTSSSKTASLNPKPVFNNAAEQFINRLDFDNALIALVYSSMH
jgi:hypothetical protein